MAVDDNFLRTMLEYWFQKNNMAPASTFWFKKWTSEGVKYLFCIFIFFNAFNYFNLTSVCITCKLLFILRAALRIFYLHVKFYCTFVMFLLQPFTVQHVFQCSMDQWSYYWTIIVCMWISMHTRHNIIQYLGEVHRLHTLEKHILWDSIVFCKHKSDYFSNHCIICDPSVQNQSHVAKT